MKCPKCGGRISFFSKDILLFTRPKRCPHCHTELLIQYNYRKMLVLILGWLVVDALVWLPALHYLGWDERGVSSTLITVVLVLCSIELKPRDRRYRL